LTFTKKSTKKLAVLTGQEYVEMTQHQGLIIKHNCCLA